MGTRSTFLVAAVGGLAFGLLGAGCISTDERVVMYAEAQHECPSGHTTITHHYIGTNGWNLDVCGVPRTYVESAGSFHETTQSEREAHAEAHTTSTEPPPRATSTFDALRAHVAEMHQCTVDRTTPILVEPTSTSFNVCGAVHVYTPNPDGTWREIVSGETVPTAEPVATPPRTASFEELRVQAGQLHGCDPARVALLSVETAEAIFDVCGMSRTFRQRSDGTWHEADDAAYPLASGMPVQQSQSPPSAPAYGTPSTGDVQVQGYYRRDGTYVHGYTRSRPHH